MTQRFGLRSRQLRSGLSFMVAALMIGSISYLGVKTYSDSHAASGASIYATPDSSSVTTGSTLSVTIREDSGSTAVNSVQASMKYDASKLQFISIVDAGDFPVVAATSTGTPGVIRVGRGHNSSSLSGDHAIATINFKVIGSGGAAAISFDKDYSFLVRGSDSKDVLENVGSANYGITDNSAPSDTTDKPILYLNPASGSFTTGANVAVAVRLNSYKNNVTTVQSVLKYPTAQLQYVSVTEGGVFTTKQRTNGSNGTVDVIRAIAGGGSGVQGDNLVVTVNFKVIGTGGAADLSLSASSAAFDDSATGQNILNQAGSAGATYTVTAGSGGTPPTPAPSAPSPPPTPAPSSGGTKTTTLTPPSQALTIGSVSNKGSVSLTTDASGASLTQLGGQVELSPVFDPTVFAKDSNASITKVEYYIDGKLVSMEKKSPFSYKLDSTKMRNGTYTMVIKTFYSTGTVDTRTDKILVNNKVNLAYVTRHYLAGILGIIIILALLAFVIWKFVVPKFLVRKLAGQRPTDHDALYGFAGNLVASEPTVVAPVADGTAEAPKPLTFTPSSPAGPTNSPKPASAAQPKLNLPPVQHVPITTAPASSTPTPATPATSLASVASIAPQHVPTPEPIHREVAEPAQRPAGIAPPTNRFGN